MTAMSTTTTVPNDVVTRHVLVVTEPFTGQSRMGFAIPPYPRGFVLHAEPLGQTNVHAGQGRRHPKAVLIEGDWKVGEIVPESELVAAIATAAAKQAEVPAQQEARRKQRAAAQAAAARVIPDMQTSIEALKTEIAALKVSKPAV